MYFDCDSQEKRPDDQRYCLWNFHLGGYPRLQAEPIGWMLVERLLYSWTAVAYLSQYPVIFHVGVDELSR